MLFRIVKLKDKLKSISVKSLLYGQSGIESSWFVWSSHTLRKCGGIHIPDSEVNDPMPWQQFAKRLGLLWCHTTRYKINHGYRIPRPQQLFFFSFIHGSEINNLVLFSTNTLSRNLPNKILLAEVHSVTVYKRRVTAAWLCRIGGRAAEANSDVYLARSLWN